MGASRGDRRHVCLLQVVLGVIRPDRLGVGVGVGSGGATGAWRPVASRLEKLDGGHVEHFVIELLIGNVYKRVRDT